MIVIPMAGLSSRFKNAGYNLPKYMLEAHGKTLFEHSVNSFKKYFSSHEFLFIALDVDNIKDFITQKCNLLGIKNYQTVILKEPTRGQAETVYLGLKQLNDIQDISLIIFNIDTFRPNFTLPENLDFDNIDGYLETFIGSGKNWSNILPVSDTSTRVKFTAEKKEISQYCCTGLYHFSNAQDFYNSFETLQQYSLDEVDGSEYYIAPMYNILISNGANIHFSIVNKKEVIFCGIPSEYEDFKNK